MKFFGGTVEAEDLKAAQAALRVRIGTNLEMLRKMRGLSLDEVATAVGGMTPDTVRNYEKGKGGISFENAWRLADFYGVSLGAIGGRIAFEPAETA